MWPKWRRRMLNLINFQYREWVRATLHMQCSHTLDYDTNTSHRQKWLFNWSVTTLYFWPPFCVIKLTTWCWPVRCKAVRNLLHWSSDVSRSSTANLGKLSATQHLQSQQLIQQTEVWLNKVHKSRLQCCNGRQNTVLVICVCITTHNTVQNLVCLMTTSFSTVWNPQDSDHSYRTISNWQN